MTQQATNLVGGEWRDPGEARQDVHNPADGSVVGTVGVGGAAEAGAAADAAAEAFEAWAATPPRQRGELLRKAADILSGRAERLGELLARETGKRRPEGVGEIKGSAEYLTWFAEEVRRPGGALHPHEAQGRRHVSVRRPAGVAASLTPWNFPCSIQARKVAPALAAGCTVVARVSEKAPLAVTELFRCLTDAGVPAGVVNLVHGPSAEVTDAYLSHPAVRVVSFTGSTSVGRRIMAKASERVVRPLLELGGDAPFIVFDDADVDAAVEGAMLAKFRNTGQSCIAANRFLVQEAVYDEFLTKFTARVDAMSVGHGLADPVPDLAACIDTDRVAAVAQMVDEALDKGARRVTRDFALPDGAFCAPALLADVPGECSLACDEVFGPAAGIFRFADGEEALARANATEMGLTGYFYTRDVGRMWRVAERLDVGIVGVNDPLPSVVFAPMGGTKQSGLGREGADLGLEEFQEVQYLSIRF